MSRKKAARAVHALHGLAPGSVAASPGPAAHRPPLRQPQRVRADLLRAELVNHLEAIPLRGPARAIRQVANRLLSIKGVRHGQLVPATGKRVM
jgi:hypothetical protein